MAKTTATPKKQTYLNRAKVFLFASILSAALISAGAWDIYHHLQLLTHGKRAHGKVVGYSLPDGKGFPVIEFQNEGKSMRFDWHQGFFFHPELGREIRFLYDPKDLNDSEVETVGVQAPVLLICAGVLSFLFGFQINRKKKQ